MFSHSIYDLLINVQPNNPFYVKRYVNFITKCSESEIGEDHHILPRSLFPEFSDFSLFPQNRKRLSGKAHYVAHLILWKAFGGKMARAFQIMTVGRECRIKNGKMYENLKNELRTIQSQKMSVDNPWTKNSVKTKIIERHGGLGFASDSIKSQYKQTMLETYGVDNFFKEPSFISANIERTKRRWKDPDYNSRTRKAISDGRKGQPIVRFSCLYCKRIIQSNNMKNHFKWSHPDFP
jgi:hypothetical protein